MHHCVRSYIGDVACKHTKIYFLREKEKLATPYVTVEVKNKKICQAKGKYNRSITNNEYAFLQNWAKEKGLILESL